MRIWDIEPSKLCRQHLLAEHRELHGIWSILTKNKSGYSRHPETMRWQGKLKALYNRHQAQVAEAKRRGWKMGIDHQTPLDRNLATGKRAQNVYVHIPEEQVKILRGKGCKCKMV